MSSKYEVIVVGSGHAGVEAGLAAARMGCKTLMLTMSADQIGTMSCNPAVGGLGKSQLAKEVDLLGGMMAVVSDQSAMQYRVLNERKGPAVQATRVHVDRHEYRARMKWVVEQQDSLFLKQGQVTKLLFEGPKLVGVETSIGQKFFSEAIVLTTGTFMNGKAHIGRQSFASGRAGEPASVGLSDYLKSIGLRLARFKTGTVPRVDAKTIDFSKTEEQTSSYSCQGLSFFSKELRSDLCSAHLSFTNPETHEIIRRSLDQSPLYSGIIESRGPRYCPSVEDKIVRFGDKDRHQVFLEKEGRHTNEVYVGGVSTSLPHHCQIEFLRTIRGLENVEIIRPGYAIEYDYIDSTQLFSTLESKDVQGLYFAGQVNGTSGYEEAAVQGLLAGANAASNVLGKESLILDRSEAYAGVLVDDLVTKGTDEPYRMLSSRAEWRLCLREDNVEERLFAKAEKWGLLSEAKRDFVAGELEKRLQLYKEVSTTRLWPSSEIKSLYNSLVGSELNEPVNVFSLIKRPGFNLEWIEKLLPELYLKASESHWKKLSSSVKYEGYIKQAESQLKQLKRFERVQIPFDLEYSEIHGLPKEAVERFQKVKPTSLGQASRIPGVTPASVSVLALYLSRQSKNGACVNA